MPSSSDEVATIALNSPRLSFCADPLLKVQRDPLGPSTAQGEDQGRAMGFDQLRDRVIHRVPILVRREWTELGSGRFYLEIHLPNLVIGARDFDWTRRASSVALHSEAREEFGEGLDWT